MIDEEILDKVCPIPDEDETMEEIKGKLGEEAVSYTHLRAHET